MYEASIENIGDSKYFATTRDSGFVMDTEGHGSSPIDALLASLCGCIGHQAREYMTRNGITSDGFSIHAEANLTTDKVLLSDLKLFIDMKRTQLDDRQKSDLLEYAKRCKIYNTLKLGCGVGAVITVQ